MDCSTIDRLDYYQEHHNDNGDDCSHQEASHREEEDHLESRWNSQKTPAFPLPLGLVSPKYPKRQVSAGLKMTASPERLHASEGPLRPGFDAPPLPPPCPIANNKSYPPNAATTITGKKNCIAPKIPLRKESVGMPLLPLRKESVGIPILPLRKESVGMPMPAAGASKPLFPPPLGKISQTTTAAPKYPIRQESVGCKLIAADSSHRAAQMAYHGPGRRAASISPDRRIGASQAA